MKLIHAHVFNPLTPSLFRKPKKTEHAQFHTVTCGASEDCPLFKRGQCVARGIASLGGDYAKCPFGQGRREWGPTPKARSFSEWIAERKAQEREIGTLSAPADRLARVRDQVWLPYLAIRQALYGDETAGTGPVWVPLADLTPDLIVKLAHARPVGWFGGEIRDYQRESVPKLLAHLAEEFPDLLKAAAEMSPKIAAILPTLTKVGRRALLATVRPNVGTFEGWTWDGTHMVSGEKSKLPPFTPFNAEEMRIRPGPRAEVKIESDAQCSPDTVLLD